MFAILSWIGDRRRAHGLEGFSHVLGYVTQDTGRLALIAALLGSLLLLLLLLLFLTNLRFNAFLSVAFLSRRYGHVLDLSFLLGWTVVLGAMLVFAAA